ncbi:MAG: protein kinase domain-containing protein [Bryobacteraceae bacterium]
MDPARWRRVEEIYQAAVERKPEEEAAFLALACAGEEDLRREVESLLAQPSADGMLDRPAWKAEAGGELPPEPGRLTVGQRVSHYQIQERLGEGGMGVVYKARDSRLGRGVALKFVKARFSRRSEREARAVAALNHPNICALHDVGPNYLVMELIEGPTLAERMAKGPVPLKEALDIARQIAGALEAAHEKGIVHRDLKPANIKLPAEGTVKVLDFGLAKALAPAAPDSPEDSPTVTYSATQAGMILGTAAYMSPEQARGQPVDKRTDIWAFGVVFYELLTGKRLFGGDGMTVSDSLAAVLTREPDFNALPKDTPPRVRRVLEHCLRKDLKQRLRDMGDARIVLDETGPETPVPFAPARRWIPWSVAGVLGLALVTSFGGWLRPKISEPGPGEARFLLPLPPGTSASAPVMSAQAVPSPDGRNLAIIALDSSSGKQSLWVRPLASTSARRLDKTEEAGSPFWSPDSRHIGFFAEGKLKRVEVSVGNVQTICEISKSASAGAIGDGGTWNEQGVIVFAAYGATPPAPLMRVPAAGGVPTAVTALEKDEMWHSWPQFLPDGRHLLYFAVNKEAENGAVYVQELGSSKRILVLKNATRSAWAPPGYLLFVREGTLFARRLNAKTFQLEGEPLAVAQDVAFNERNGRSTFAVSRNGVLAYRSGTSSGMTRQLTWYDRRGKRLGTIGKPGEFMNPSLSPDEKSVAISVGTPGRLDTWVMDLTSGVMARMTHRSQEALHSTPAWSPDSQRLAITQITTGIHQVALASGKVTPLAKELLVAEDWSPDGSSILCTASAGKQLVQLSLAGGARLQTILDTPSGKVDFRFSPDGRYVAYVSNESGQDEVYVTSFPTFATKRKISSSGGRYPAWARRGKEIVYLAADGALMSAEIRTGSNLAAGTPKLLFKPPGSGLGRFAVTADGNRVLINGPAQKTEGEKPEITLVLNWSAGIR